MRKPALGRLLGFALAGLYLVSPAFAQRGRGRPIHTPRTTRTHEAPLEVFQRMTLQERERAMAALPPERRKKLQKQLDAYDRLTPAQKNQLDWFNHLPPDRQESFRKVYKKFVSEPPERQQLMRDEMSRLNALPQQERKARLASPELRSRFNKNEHQILSQMAEALPPE